MIFSPQTKKPSLQLSFPLPRKFPIIFSCITAALKRRTCKSRETVARNHDSLSFFGPGKAILCTHNLGLQVLMFLCQFSSRFATNEARIPFSWFLFTKYKQIQKITRYISIYIYMYICIYTYIYTYIYIYIYIYVYIYVYIRTHTSFACFGLSLGHICDLKTHAVHLGPRIQHLACRSSKLHGWCAWKAP